MELEYCQKLLEVGMITRDIVYKRLAPGVLEELEQKNPLTEQGYRKVKHHQYLSSEIGHPALAQHLHTIVCLMRASSNWKHFYHTIQKVFPMQNEQLHFNWDTFEIEKS
jgi:hypothetical protein